VVTPPTCGRAEAALLIRMSRPPSSRTAASATADAPSAERRSPAMKTASTGVSAVWLRAVAHRGAAVE
jgi:hypothetical protein